MANASQGETAQADGRLALPIPPPPPGLPARRKRAVLYVLSFVADCTALTWGYLLALAFRDAEWLLAENVPIIVAALPLFAAFSILRRVQTVEALEDYTVAIYRAIGALFATALVLLAFSYFTQNVLSRIGFGIMFVSAGVFIVAGKLALSRILERWMNGSATATILLNDGMRGLSIPNARQIVLADWNLSPDLDRPETIDAISRLIIPYDRVIAASPRARRELWSIFLKSQDRGGEILVEDDLLHDAIGVNEAGGWDTLVMSRRPLRFADRIQKRAFDLVLASVALLVLSPALLLVAIAIKLEDRGPVLFRQRRVGQGNRQFRIIKFRSMQQTPEDQAASASTARDDARITRVGRFLRRTSLDELPQLFNVMAGDMSLVGPRPHALGSLAGDDLFWRVDRRYWTRHALKPGLTGLAQVRGYRGPTETEDALRNRVHSDLEYLTRWSVGLDVLILLRTVRVLLHPNAY